jgi:HD-GYP domain-containing protein (c-di-GMP phosphodiesterase class II)
VPRPPDARLSILAGGLVVPLLVGVLYVYRPTALTHLDHRVYDALLRAVHHGGTTARVVIVDLDEKSLAQFGRWPWPRSRLARLLEKIHRLGASTIALDMMFPEPDESAPEPSRRVGAPGDPAGAPPSHPAAPTVHDAALADVLRRGPFVLGFEFTFEKTGDAGGTCVRRPARAVALHQAGGGAGATPLVLASGAICSVDALSDAAPMSGFLNAAPDGDGILRRIPQLIEYRGQLYPSLALAALIHARDAGEVVLTTTGSGAGSLRLDDLVVPLDVKGNLLLHFRGRAKTFPYLSAADILADRFPAEALKDKIVLLGTATLGLGDTMATPLETIFPGVEVHATAVDNLLRKDFVRRPQDVLALELLAVVGLGIASVVLLVWVRSVLAPVVLATTGVSLWAAAGWVLQATGVFVSPLFPSLVLGLSFSTVTLANFLVERRRAERSARNLVFAQKLMLHSLISLTEMRDRETGSHILRTPRYTKVLCESLASNRKFRVLLTPDMIELLASLAPLHDIGKVGVPDALLRKPGRLTADEFTEMKKHPVYGRDAIEKAEQRVGVRNDVLLRIAKDIVYAHHEWWDGSGYPEGLRGEAIPIAGRIVALVDVYDALVSKRVYKGDLSHDEVVKRIVERKGTQFDPDVVDAFLRVEAEWRRISREFADQEDEHEADD